MQSRKKGKEKPIYSIQAKDDIPMQEDQLGSRLFGSGRPPFGEKRALVRPFFPSDLRGKIRHSLNLWSLRFPDGQWTKL